MNLRYPFLLITTILASLTGCDRPPEPSADPSGEVVVYTSVDDVFARPVAEKFQAETGIVVKLVPDTEETKSTGLLNRLIAEKDRPVADVFWSGDPARATILKAKGVSAPYHSPNAEGMAAGFHDPEGHWSALSARARVIIYNKTLVPEAEAPRELAAFLDPKWKGKTCIASPLFGTTSMHAAALFAVRGEEGGKAFFEGLLENGVAVLSSNGEVKRRVAAGDYAFGLTDTDDASVALGEGKPVGVVYPGAGGEGTLVMPNAAVLIANGPNSDNGKRFIDYLLTAEVEQALAESEASQMPLRPGVPVPDNVRRVSDITAMKLDYAETGALLDRLSKGYLKDWSDRAAAR